jgi:hypothetical protein
VTPGQLVIGNVYFAVYYEDEEMTKMVIQSYEYLKTENSKDGEGPFFIFRPISPFPLGESSEFGEARIPSPYDGEVALTPKNLLTLTDLAGLIDHLQRVQRNGPGRVWGDAS